jgi:large subunit ribosomal protein L23
MAMTEAKKEKTVKPKAKKPAREKTAKVAAAPSTAEMAKHYDVILSPWVTEKATNGSQYNQITFKVALGATKPQIRAAVEALFKVEVTGVNTSILGGKTKRFRGRIGTRSDMKKAIVTLKEGQSIDIATGI